MEKEMKKLLLVAVSVGVFLLVTVSAAILLLTPKTQTQGATFTSSIPNPGVITNVPAQPDNIITPEPVIETPDIVTIADRNNGDSVTIQIPTIPVTVVSSNAGTSSTNTANTTNTTRTTTVTPAPAANTTSTSNTNTTTTPRPVATRTINDYWIQIGAYSAIFRAEDVKELLASKGLVSIIENSVVNGRSLYRVRLGPYTSEREANHWLAIVKAIDGFGDSQVRQTIRQQ